MAHAYDPWCHCAGCNEVPEEYRKGIIYRKNKGWHPISTAPHEEKVLLGWWDTSGTWNTDYAYATQGWSRNGVSTRSAHAWATHWQPRPDPPAVDL